VSRGTGRGNFTAAAEVEGGHSLRLGFYQHMALTRNVYNPLEKGDVVGITNYLDLGIQLVTPLSEHAPPSTKPGIRIAGAWQVRCCALPPRMACSQITSCPEQSGHVS
jgi:hypothetical protein